MIIEFDPTADGSVADHPDMSQAAEPVQQADSPTRPVTSTRERNKERQRQKRARDRQQLVYETADWQLFIDSATLPQKAGCQPHRIRQIVIKELVDNALDAGASVTLDLDGDTWIVSDDGPGMDPADVPKLYAVNRLSSKLRRLPLRGMLGNGLRVVVGAVVAYGGSLVVETRGRRMALSICSSTGVTTVTTDEPVPNVPGTVVRLGGRGWDGPETATLARGSIVLAQGAKTYTGVSSPWWYGAKDLHRLFAGVTPEETTVGRVCNSLGLEYDDDRIARSLTPAEAATVLDELRLKYEPVPPEALGFLRQDANLIRDASYESIAYAGKGGIHTNQAGAVIPYAVEAWVGCHRSSQRGQGSVGITVALNRSITVNALRGTSSPAGIMLDGCSLMRHVSGPVGDYSIVLSIITPYVQLSGDGKEPVLTPYSEAIVEVVGKACRAAYRRIDRPEHGMSIKDAAWQVMEQAYDKASSGRTLPANARQIMYAARGDILRMTGKTTLDDNYFIQTLLNDYVAEHKQAEDWDVVYDARGSLIEPHTGREIHLGTEAIRQ